MLRYINFREIQNNPQFQKFEGIFLIILIAIVIIIFIIFSVVTGTTAKICVIIFGLVSIYALREISRSLGWRGLKKIIGNKNQPNLIIITKTTFHLKIEKDKQIKK